MQKGSRIIIDLIVLMVAFVVLALVVLPGVDSLMADTRSAVDTASLSVLNQATTMYRLMNGVTSDDAFAGCVTNEARMQILVEAQFLEAVPAPQQSDAAFQWDKNEQAWVLYVQGEAASITALGSTFTEISSALIQLELDRKSETGSFGRSWGSYAYTDLGLIPEDWETPVEHIYYKPCGSQIMISPEKGYTFLVEDMSGVVRKLPASYNWNLIGDCATGTWYYHLIAADNQIDITTLRVVAD